MQIKMSATIAQSVVAGGSLTQGPLCDHHEPTVLRELNGRKVYVCSRFPLHHCRTCCPLDEVLLSRQRQAFIEEGPAEPEESAAFGSPIPPMSPLLATAQLAVSLDFGEGVEGALSPADSTPNSHTIGTPSVPKAPSKSKSHVFSSATSRTLHGGAPRSLIPVFNGFAPAAARAHQLGGRFGTLRPGTHTAIAKRHCQPSGSVEKSNGPGKLPGTELRSTNRVIPGKRCRISSGASADSGPPSVHTASRDRERRIFDWDQEQKPIDVKASKQPRM